MLCPKSTSGAAVLATVMLAMSNPPAVLAQDEAADMSVLDTLFADPDGAAADDDVATANDSSAAPASSRGSAADRPQETADETVPTIPVQALEA